MKNPAILTSFLIVTGIFYCSGSLAQTNNVSSSPDPYCVGFTYTANAGGTAAQTLEPGNDYDCLFSTPNPSWFFLKAETAGDIDLNLYAANDIDFIIYGPFADLNELISMSGQLGVNPEAPIVDCSYSPINSEYPVISGMAANDYYLLLVTNYASVVQDITIEQIGGSGSLNCEVFNEPFHQISGTVFYDLNQNGSMDPGEYPLPNAAIQINPTGYNLTSNTAGNFNYNYFTTDSIYYTVSASLNGWTNTSPDQIMFSLDTLNNDSTGLLFGFFPDSIYTSNELDVIGITSSCVLENTVWINVSNSGTVSGDGIISLTLDAGLAFLNASYPVDSIAGNTLYFSFNSLPPFNSLSVQVQALPSPWLTAVDTVINYVNLLLPDSTSYTDSTVNAVFCSYDPNNKIALPNGNLSPSNIIEPTDKLEYIINFQNTGTAPAVNVKITDQLSTLLDETTFEFLSSSHPTYVSLDSSGNLVFDFTAINLPDSASNEPMSKGYVKFRIALNTDVVPNNVVENTASIYFDNNAPVITNTTVNVLSCFIQPDPVILSYADGTISSNLSSTWFSYEWMLDGVPLAGGSMESINCTDDGVYTLVVYNQYGCETSGSYTYTQSTSGLPTGESLTATVYPNPSNGDFQIRFTTADNYRLTVVDESGREVFTDTVSNGSSYLLKGNELEQGVYFVRISDTTGNSGICRLVKL